jgi:hypothetical protein
LRFGLALLVFWAALVAGSLAFLFAIAVESPNDCTVASTASYRICETTGGDIVAGIAAVIVLVDGFALGLRVAGKRISRRVWAYLCMLTLAAAVAVVIISVTE